MSDRSFRGARELVIGTAGHIDHGKTSLVRALTGIDTDRLAEEKRRGISIDLGFAHLGLEGGREISFIDVPGHERFIKNMLAGVGGIQAVLLVVAADESVKPQTREHFEICRLLEIQHGIVVLTKADLANPEQMRITCEDVKALCAGSYLEGAPMVAVSATTGAGLRDLKRELALLAERVAPAEAEGVARLPIDRSFALKGFGTVVTGTLRGGTFSTGEIVEIHLSNQEGASNREARIRGLQVHGKPVASAHAGQRTAVNLAGIDHAEIRRGSVLAQKCGLETTKTLDVSVDWLRDEDIPAKRKQFLFHAGTAEIPAVLKVLSSEAPKRTIARLFLSEPALISPEDRFVLRRTSPAQTVAGGFIIDTFPPRRLNRTKTIARLQSLANADLSKRVEILAAESTAGRRIPELTRLTGQPGDAIESLVSRSAMLMFEPAGQRVLTKAWIEERRHKLIQWLAAFHAKSPSAAGAPVSLARLGLEPALANLIFHDAATFRVQGDLVSLTSHKARLDSAETQAVSKIEHAFRQAGFQPPAPNDVLQSTGLDRSKARGLLEALIKAQKLVRISEGLIFHADAILHIRKSLATHKGRRFSIPEFKEWTQISRKYAIPLLEYLDHQHVTRRDGDARVVL